MAANDIIVITVPKATTKPQPIPPAPIHFFPSFETTVEDIRRRFGVKG